jgi:hypothetical protein
MFYRFFYENMLAIYSLVYTVQVCSPRSYYVSVAHQRHRLLRSPTMVIIVIIGTKLTPPSITDLKPVLHVFVLPGDMLAAAPQTEMKEKKIHRGVLVFDRLHTLATARARRRSRWRLRLSFTNGNNRKFRHSPDGYSSGGQWCRVVPVTCWANCRSLKSHGL